MPEYIMQYDIDETGKLINARRKEELIRCRDCVNIRNGSGVGECSYTYRIVKPDGYCDAGKRKEKQ